MPKKATLTSAAAVAASGRGSGDGLTVSSGPAAKRPRPDSPASHAPSTPHSAKSPAGPEVRVDDVTMQYKCRYLFELKKMEAYTSTLGLHSKYCLHNALNPIRSLSPGSRLFILFYKKTIKWGVQEFDRYSREFGGGRG